MTKTKTYTVQPLNDIKANMDKFDWAYSWLENVSFKTPAKDEPLEIELIQCRIGQTEDILKEIDERGYIPAPSPYLLGLGVQYPKVHKEYKYIVSLDEKNLLLDGDGDPCFLSLGWDGERRLGLATRAGEWDVDWWFAVVRKDASTLNPEPLNTQALNASLEEAIKIVKEAGYKVIKEF